MPSISNKGQSMPQSPIRKLVPYAEEAVKKGKSIYYLNIGQPDIKTPKVALQAVKETNIEVLAYSRSEGSETYRQKISSYYAKHEIYVKHDDIIDVRLQKYISKPGIYGLLAKLLSYKLLSLENIT